MHENLGKNLQTMRKGNEFRHRTATKRKVKNTDPVV